MAKISNSVVIELGAVASSNGLKKRKISIVKNSRKMPRNSQNGKNISNSVVIELGAVAQVIKINKFRQVWTSLGKVRQDWTRLDRLDKIEQVQARLDKTGQVYKDSNSVDIELGAVASSNG